MQVLVLFLGSSRKLLVCLDIHVQKCFSLSISCYIRANSDQFLDQHLLWTTLRNLCSEQKNSALHFSRWSPLHLVHCKAVSNRYKCLLLVLFFYIYNFNEIYLQTYKSSSFKSNGFSLMHWYTSYLKTSLTKNCSLSLSFTFYHNQYFLCIQLQLISPFPLIISKYVFTILHL